MISEKQGAALLFELLDFREEQLLVYFEPVGKTARAHVFLCSAVYHFFVKGRVVGAKGPPAFHTFVLRHLFLQVASKLYDIISHRKGKSKEGRNRKSHGFRGFLLCI